MDIVLYTLAKAENSTKQPTDGTTVSGIIRENSSIQNPTVSFDFGTENAPAFNYAAITPYGRFYFITNWEWDGRLWVAYMSVDRMGTYKEYIGASKQYVVRSASAYSSDITDTLFPTTNGNTQVSYGVVWSDPNFYASVSSGTYVVGIVNKDANAIGSVSYYGFISSEFRTFCNYMFSSTEWIGEITDIGEDLLKCLFDPFQYVVSCMWFPFDFDKGTHINSIDLGWWELPTPCRRLSSTSYLNSGTAKVPKNPNITSNQTYMNAAPFAKYFLNCFTWGTIPIDPQFVYKKPNLYLEMRVDLVSGEGILSLGTEKGYAETKGFMKLHANVGVEIQLAQVMRNRLDVATSAIGGIAGGVLGALTGNIGGVISNTLNGISSAAENFYPQVENKGVNGNVESFAISPYFVAYFYNSVGLDYERFGRPLCRLVTIGNLSGYIKCSNPHMDTIPTATLEEQTAIESFMEQGFFYE